MVFTSVGLPVLPPTSVYELWFIGVRRRAARRPRAGRATRHRARHAAPVLAAGLSGGDAVGVTVEPIGGIGGADDHHRSWC